MIEGKTVKLRGKEFVIPPLTLGQWKRFLPLITKMQSCTDFMENIAGLTTIVHAALLANYPEIKIEEVEDLIDFSNMKEVMEAVLPLGFLQTSALAGNFGVMS
jgi:hypothetical protein